MFGLRLVDAQTSSHVLISNIRTAAKTQPGAEGSEMCLLFGLIRTFRLLIIATE